MTANFMIAEERKTCFFIGEDCGRGLVQTDGRLIDAHSEVSLFIRHSLVALLLTELLLKAAEPYKA